MAAYIPRVPFYFRIYSDDGNGIMYKAVEQLDQDTYNCIGTRIIGHHNGYTIWEFGGYMDVMPASSIHEIVEPRRLRKEEKDGIIRQEKLNPALKSFDGFCDDTSYWFIKKSKKSASRSRSRSSGSSGSNRGYSKTRKSKGKKSGSKAAGGGSSGGW